MSEDKQKPDLHGESTNEKKSSPWNSLEVTKLLSSFITGLLLAVVGYMISQRLAEQTQQFDVQNRLQQYAVEERIKIYNKIRAPLSHIFDYIEDLGTWKEDDPETIIAYKRKIDTEMWSERLFF